MRKKTIRWMVSTLVACAAWLAFGGTQFGLAQDAAPPAAAAPDSAPTPDVQSVPAGEPSSPVPATAPVSAESPAPVPDAAAVKPQVAPKPVLIPYLEQVYPVSISVGVDPDAELTIRDAQRIVDKLRGLVESRIGKWWKCDVAQAAPGEPLNQAMLVHRSVDSWNAALEATAFDKRFAVTIDRVGTEFRVSGIEWDRASQSITSIEVRRTFDRRLLAALATEIVFKQFRPLVSIDQVTGGNVEMRVRGGEILPPDASLIPFREGDHVSVFLRHLGKNRELKRLQSIPWTMIRVDVADRSYLRGTIISAFASPLTVSRRRVEMLGLKVHTTHPSTRLQVIPRGKPQAPMAGYRVEVLNRPETKDDKVEDRVTLRTDRKGEVVIPADPEKPVRYVIVYSGAAPLAKAPLIPGYLDRVVLDAPDDAPRLNVEAETDLLQSELIDIVARREVLMARARGASKSGNWELVSEMQKKVAELPTLEQFLARIDALRNPAVQSAKRTRDRGQESRIVRMCKEITDTAKLHLDPLKVKEFNDEINEEKKSQ